MTPTLKAKQQQHLEDKMQETVCAHLRIRGVPDMLFWHTPNSSKMGGKRTSSGVPLAALRLKRQGMLAGVSDLVFLHNATFYALELKVKPNKPTDAQFEFMDRVKAAGGYAHWTDSLERALKILEAWGLIRPDINRLEPAEKSCLETV
jgi:hypothetical protein